MGNECMTWGTYLDSGAATEDNINTKLHLCTRIILQPHGSSVSTNAPAVNETLPVAGSAVTVICDASQSGMWYAWGDMFV